MDFTKRDARAAAETAQFCHLRDQETGEYMMDGDTPIGAFALGTSARSVQAQLKADNRAKLQDAATKEDEIKALADIQADMVKSAARLTTAFQGIHRGEAEATAADAEWFYDLTMFSTAVLLKPDPKKWQKQSYAQQVLEFANNNGKYLGND